MQYTVDYFIEKFQAIPEEKWTTGDYKSHNGCCALGHCGIENLYGRNEEADALRKLFFVFPGDCPVQHINDASNAGFNKYNALDGPKQRILAALYDIKKMQYPELSNTTVEDLIGQVIGKADNCNK